MSDSVLSIEDLHLSFPIFAVTSTRSTTFRWRLAGVKLSAWWANPARENRLPRCWRCACCRKAVTIFIMDGSRCSVKMS